MASRNAAVAEAVKGLLNAAAAADPPAFGERFTAARVYAPVGEPEKQRSLVATVWAPGDAATQIARGVREYEIPVLVALAKKLTEAAGDGSTEAANAELDALMELAERVADFFGPEHADVGGASWGSTDLNLGNPDAMRERRQFLAVATFRFQLRKKR